jgi:CheY-like chemotaxis protein
VIGDANRLRQVVWNLLSNAIKFTAERGDVAVRLERVDDTARITVSDTGRGIGAADMPHVFEQFRQADSSTSRSTGGLGLGLAIVRHVVAAHGGTVAAASAGVGLGSAFTVDLPITAEPGAAPGALHGIGVLLVEDDADAAEFVSLLLANQGAQVRRAATVEEALDVLTSFTPDVVVSDLGLSSDDGFSLIRRLRGLPGPLAGVPALAFTAYVEPATIGAALEAGFDEHLAKPADPERLMEAVGRLAQRGRATPA